MFKFIKNLLPKKKKEIIPPQRIPNISPDASINGVLVSINGKPVEFIIGANTNQFKQTN